MPERFRINYSLWPERARPHRSTPLAYAIGGFAVGVLCVIATYAAFPDTGMGRAVKDPAAPRDVDRGPIFTNAIGAEPAVPLTSGAATDGRGGAEPASSVATLPSSGNPEGVVREEGDSTAASISTGADAEEAKPPPTVRKKIIRKRKKIVRGKRKKVARKSRQPTRYRKRYGNNLVSETAIWY
jgi:hypothetical protein